MSHGLPQYVKTKADELALQQGYYWDQAQADRVIAFAETYFKPKFSHEPFQLFPWQKAFLQRIYGFRRADGSLRWRKVLLHCPKKNSKTLLTSIISTYETYASFIPSPLVCSASTSRDNAKQVFENIAHTVRHNPKLSAISKIVDSMKLIRVKPKGAEFRSLSCDAPNAEGLNISCCIVDEAHAHKSDKLYRTLEYSMIGRQDGFMVIISTAGNDLSHWYYDLYSKGKRIQKGEDTDLTFMAEIYEAETDDIESEAAWKKANPSLDLYKGFTTERFRQDLLAAKSNTADWLAFKRYRLNIFCQSSDTAWIDLLKWDQNKAHYDEATLKQYPCYLGFDGSQRVDPTSVSAIWCLPDKKFYAKSWAFVCSEGVKYRDKLNLPKYQNFAADGSMTITQGDLIDKDKVKSLIMSLKSKFDVKALVMDPTLAWVFGNELMQEGIEVYRQPQTFKYFNEPTKSFEEAVIEKRLLHDGSGWLRWSVGAVRLVSDSYGNVRPSKDKAVDHIDGAISLIMAYSMAMRAEITNMQKKSVYDTRGVLTI